MDYGYKDSSSTLATGIGAVLRKRLEEAVAREPNGKIMDLLSQLKEVTAGGHPLKPPKASSHH